MAQSLTKRVFDDIQGKADYYAPETYAGLLTFNSSLALSPDAMTDFIPVSQTTPNTKLFVIGLIPPSATITGRLLDRSASVASKLGSPTGVDISGAFQTSGSGAAGVTVGTGASDKGHIVTAAGYTIPLGSGAIRTAGTPGGTPPGPPGAPPTYTQYSVPDLWRIASQAYREIYGHDATPTEMQFYVAQMLRETGGKIPNNNFGFVGNYGSPDANGGAVFLNSNGKYFNTYTDPVAGAKSFIAHVSGNDNARYAAQQGDALGYVTSLAQTGYFTEPISVYYGGQGKYAGVYPRLLTQVADQMRGSGVTLGTGADLPSAPPDTCAFNETGFQYRARIGATGLTGANLYRFRTGSPYDDACPLGLDGTTSVPSTAGAGPSSWAGAGGSKAASDAKKEQALSQDQNLNQSDLGRKLSAAQQAEIFATAQALELMKNTPPLRFLVNPTSFKVASEKVISDGNWTRNGPIIEHWGDGQDKIDFSGRIAGIMAVDTQPKGVGTDPNNPDGVGGPGLTRVSRNYTAAYQNLLSLWLLYRNNAYLYLNGLDASRVNDSKTVARLSLVGSVYIFYDGILYIGSFDSFNMTEAEEKPYSMDYSITFTVRAAFLLDQPIDPQESYGPQAAQFFATRDQITTSDQAAKDAATAAETSANAALKAAAEAEAAKGAAAAATTAAASSSAGVDPRFAGDVPLGPSTKFGGGPGGGVSGLPGSSDPFGTGGI